MYTRFFQAALQHISIAERGRQKGRKITNMIN